METKKSVSMRYTFFYAYDLANTKRCALLR